MNLTDRVRVALEPILAPTSMIVLRSRRDRRTFRATDGRTTVAVRVDLAPDPDAIARSAAAQGAAAAAGIAPDCLLADPAAGILVTSWAPGAPWTDDDLHVPHRIRALAKLLRTLHAVPCDLPAFDLAGHVASYRERASRPTATGDLALRSDLDALEDLAARHLETRRLAALGHHDVNAGNVVGDPPMLIDWEYAARSDPALDVATVTALHALDPDSRSQFLDAFPGLDRAVIARHERLVLALARVWVRLERIEDPTDPRARAWAERLGLDR